ncbi:mRNA cap guanine-N7 methyltransferase [Vairimorpha necatrix]|uniref:mRNA cap guanine-N(7) methyltransferase n=1 Tax=Vairimorpha necatrix TaxID=6039 RepID=A0AAX4JE05_9MICR
MEIREHYNNLKRKSHVRHDSETANIRYINNFIKAILIRYYVRPKMSILDLGCGRGGDLKKFSASNISEYYGLDISEASVYDARLRHNCGSSDFRCYFDSLDVYNTVFNLKKEFDTISCQFSLHYAFSSVKSCEITVGNINRHLKIGGYFIFTVPNKEEILRRYKEDKLNNKFFRIRYSGEGNEYYFTLTDCIDDCIEYFVDMKLLISLFDFFNIRLVRRELFDEFYSSAYKFNREMAVRMKCGDLSKEDLEVISLYEVCVFKKF